jgi:hypothetical protein
LTTTAVAAAHFAAPRPARCADERHAGRSGLAGEEGDDKPRSPNALVERGRWLAAGGEGIGDGASASDGLGGYIRRAIGRPRVAPIWPLPAASYVAWTLATVACAHTLNNLFGTDGSRRVAGRLPGQYGRPVLGPCDINTHQRDLSAFGGGGATLAQVFHGRPSPISHQRRRRGSCMAPCPIPCTRAQRRPRLNPARPLRLAPRRPWAGSTPSTALRACLRPPTSAGWRPIRAATAWGLGLIGRLNNPLFF